MRNVTTVECNCVYNRSSKCKHVAALIEYVNTEESVTKTSHSQEWGKPSNREFGKNKYSKGRMFGEMFKKPNKKYGSSQPLHIDELKSPSPLRTHLLEASKDQEDAAIELFFATAEANIHIAFNKDS